MLLTVLALLAGVALLALNANVWRRGLASATSTANAERPRIPSATNTLAKALADKLSELDSRLDVGMTIHEYSEYVGGLQAQFDSLGREPQATEHPAYGDLEAALKQYRFASDVWNHYFSSSGSNHFLPEWSPYASVLISEYGVQPTRLLGGREKIYLPRALSAIWARAGTHEESARAKCAE